MGLRYLRNVERVQYYLCKRFLNVRFRAHNNATLGECGRYPLYICTIMKVIQYWNKILCIPEHRCVYKCYKMLHYLDSVGRQSLATEVKQVLHTMAWLLFGNNRKLQMKRYFSKG